jgi:hypothetical protein
MSVAAARRRPTDRAGVAEKSRLTTTPARTMTSATTNPQRSLLMRTWGRTDSKQWGLVPHRLAIASNEVAAVSVNEVAARAT